jgi:hypothetical protein
MVLYSISVLKKTKKASYPNAFLLKLLAASKKFNLKSGVQNVFHHFSIEQAFQLSLFYLSI